jgi:hypothetical protein
VGIEMSVDKKMYQALSCVHKLLNSRHDPLTAKKLDLIMSQLDKHFTPFEVTKEMIDQLRKETGEGIMACKEALVATRGLHFEAKEWLRSNY